MEGSGLRWLFFGAGAIGTYIGGSLACVTSAASSQQKVVFVERPDIAALIRAQGLHLNLGGQVYSLPAPQVTGSLSEALVSGPFDVAVFALKSYDTQAALEGFRAYKDDLPPFLCLQNGVENEPALEAFLGKGRVMAGTVTSAVGRKAGGDIVLERFRGMGLAAGHPLSEPIAMAFNSAGLNCRVYPDAASMKWSKMLTNLMANATSAILDMTPAEIFAHPRLFNLEMTMLREALSVLQALGLRPVDLPGTPVTLLALAVKVLPAALARPLLQKAVGGGRGGKMPSFHIDLHKGVGRSEVDFLNGAVVRYGARTGVPTPVNRLLNETLLKLTSGELKIESFSRQPEALLRLL